MERFSTVLQSPAYTKPKKNVGTFDILQMALWHQQGPRLYLPPAPVAKVLCTETFVKRKNVFYHAESERLLTVGHPLFAIPDKHIPKVNGNQFRVFKVQLPDPNQFALPDTTVHNPSKERLVWCLIGTQVSRGQPLNPTVTGHHLFNVWTDAENITAKRNAPGTDDRKQLGLDSKQSQVLIVGCQPALGEYWGKALPCSDKEVQAGECPPIELKSKVIEDGDMMEIGLGACDWADLNDDVSTVPIDFVGTKSLYPDYLKMSEEPTGNSLFFFARKEQLYIRHIFSRGGQQKEEIPKDLFLEQQISDNKIRSYSFLGTPSGSLVSTDGQIFNRPYWLFQAQGLNNGVCWENCLFLTVGDNTRGGVINISVSSTGAKLEKFTNETVNIYQRHVEEYKIALILELCSVELTSDTVGYLQTTNPGVLEQWEISMQNQASNILEDTYRYTDSSAIKCVKEDAAKPKDKYSGLSFWDVDLREKLSLDLDQYPLGRRFLAQRGVTCSRKRKAATSTATSKRKKTR